ncbi:MAG: DUF4199 domain-containing protein [Bacteroidales bacterium]|nr:DUF4199 domain-containing protein [Bacteroidales bacterium]
MRQIYNSAATAGLIFAAISISYMFLTQLLGQCTGIPVFLNSIITFVLWVAKFIGCILLMKALMSRLVKKNEGITNSDTMKFGFVTSLLSALLIAGASFINIEYISTDLMTESYNAMMQVYSKMLDSNSIAALEKMMGNMSYISFFSNLIYCTLYGTILSFILSRNIPQQDPFANYKPQE